MMNNLLRKDFSYKEKLQNKFKEQIKELEVKTKDQLMLINNIENERSNLLSEYESELNKIKQNYFIKSKEILKRRDEEIKKLKEIQNKKDNHSYWLKVLTNSKEINNIINEKDYDLLNYLNNISYEYINNPNYSLDSFKLIFSFDKNDYFTNEFIEKEFYLSNDNLIQEIKSTKINWNKDKNYFTKKKKKTFINQKTKEKKEIIIEKETNSFFNYFYNFTFPNNEIMKNTISFKQEKELGELLDKDYIIGLQIKNEIIPHSTEYYIGMIQDIEKYTKYVEKNFDDFIF